MIGSIIGDVVGSRLEFAGCKDPNFKMISGFCDYTDDTICTVAIMDWLLNLDAFRKEKGLHSDSPAPSPKDYLLKWCRKYPNPTGSYGFRFSQWIYSNNPQPYNSWGNGAAMRCFPIAMYAATPEDAWNLSEVSAAVTHNYPNGILYTRLCVMLGFFYLRKRTKEYSVSGLISDIFSDKIEECRDIYSLPYPDQIREDYKFTEEISKTVMPAISCVVYSDSFKSSIRDAISLGGDADTLGAIAGGLAECKFGLEHIPKDLREFAESKLPKEMLNIVYDFYKMCKENKNNIM